MQGPWVAFDGWAQGNSWLNQKNLDFMGFILFYFIFDKADILLSIFYQVIWFIGMCMLWVIIYNAVHRFMDKQS